MGRTAPIWGLIGLYQTYLAHKQDQREQERLDIDRGKIETANEIARRTFEQEYGTTAPDYGKPRIGGIADYARPGAGDIVQNYPEGAYETKRTPGLQRYRAETERLKLGDKGYLNTPVAQDEFDEKLQALKDFDAQAGTNIVSSLNWMISGVQKEITRGTPRIAIAQKVHKIMTNPANVKNMLKRLDLAGDNENVQMMKEAVQSGTFTDLFFPVAMENIRTGEAERAGKWTGTPEAAEYGRETKKQVAEIYSKAWGKGKSSTTGELTPKVIFNAAKDKPDYINERQKLATDAMGNIIVEDKDGKRRPATKEEIEEKRREWGKEYDLMMEEAATQAKGVKGKVTKKEPGLGKQAVEIEEGEEGPPEPPPRLKNESLEDYLKRVKGSVTF